VARPSNADYPPLGTHSGPERLVAAHDRDVPNHVRLGQLVLLARLPRRLHRVDLHRLRLVDRRLFRVAAAVHFRERIQRLRAGLDVGRELLVVREGEEGLRVGHHVGTRVDHLHAQLLHALRDLPLDLLLDLLGPLLVVLRDHLGDKGVGLLLVLGKHLLLDPLALLDFLHLLLVLRLHDVECLQQLLLLLLLLRQLPLGRFDLLRDLLLLARAADGQVAPLTEADEVRGDLLVDCHVEEALLRVSDGLAVGHVIGLEDLVLAARHGG